MRKFAGRIFTMAMAAQKLYIKKGVFYLSDYIRNEFMKIEY